MTITNTGVSKSANMITQIFFLKVIRTAQIEDVFEYPWDKLKKVEAGSHWFRKCIILTFKYDNKTKVFTVAKLNLMARRKKPRT